MTRTDDTALKLIESVYRAALDPRGYDDFMGSWDDWMSSRLTALEGLRLQDPSMTAPEIAAHFELALRLLEKLSDTPHAPRMKGPQILVDAEGQVLWQNAESDRLLGTGRGRNLADFDISAEHRRQLLGFLSELTSAPDLNPFVVQMTAPDGGRPLAFRAERIREGGNRTLALLSSLTPSWPAAADKLLMDTHRLTASECAVCTLLVDGLAPAVIAQRRGTSIATVRTQIKKIQSKTRQSSTAELQSYLFGLMRMAEDLPAPEIAVALPAPSGGRIHDELVNGRRMIVEEHGPRDGRPVVFVHGMLDGTATTGVMKDLLTQHNLRLICPHRPGFGRSEPLACAVPEAASSFAADLALLLADWGVTEPVILGHMAGSVYSYAAAPVVRARGVVIVSGGVPIIGQDQFDAMTRRQRLVAYTARYAPNMLSFVLNAGIRQIKGGGEETFLRSLYEHAPVDLALLETDMIRALMLDGIRFTVAQGPAAFATDSYHVVRDWSPLVAQTSGIPIHLLHSTHDHVVAPASVRAFARRHAGHMRLTEVTDAGQLMFYQMPEMVLETVAQMAAEPLPQAIPAQ